MNAHRLLLPAALCCLLSIPAAAQTAAERLRAMGEDMVEREFDLVPAFEAFTQGAGPPMMTRG